MMPCTGTSMLLTLSIPLPYTSFRHETGTYDRILVDAPCSSERHVMHSGEEMMTWAPSRSRKMAERQVRLLLAAVRALRPGGRVVYSTCSLSPTENDDVVEAVLAKSRYPISSHLLVDGELPFGERTKRGWHVLPDNNPHQFGPIYIAVLVRGGVAVSRGDGSDSSVYESSSDEEAANKAEE